MENPEDCNDQGEMPSLATPPPADEQAPIVMPPLPGPMFEHPQSHPDASTPPEPALDGFGNRDAAAGYGGVAGGVIPQGFDATDACPTGMSHADILRGSEQFWGPQWKGTE